MFYLLWALLNLTLLIYFIAICFKATKLLRANSGWFVSIIFVFGFLSSTNFSNNESNNPSSNLNKFKTSDYILADSLNQDGKTSFLEIKLEDNFISEYNLNIIYSKNKQSINVPLNAYSDATGFMIGTNWKPFRTIVKPTSNNNKFEYTVEGIVQWRLIGPLIYRQLKTYNGFVFIKNEQD